MAKLVVDIATGNVLPEITVDGKDAAAVSLGRRGGLKGGKARAEKLSPKKRTEIARLASASRWGKKKRG